MTIEGLRDASRTGRTDALTLRTTATSSVSVTAGDLEFGVLLASETQGIGAQNSRERSRTPEPLAPRTRPEPSRATEPRRAEPSVARAHDRAELATRREPQNERRDAAIAERPRSEQRPDREIDRDADRNVDRSAMDARSKPSAEATADADTEATTARGTENETAQDAASREPVAAQTDAAETKAASAEALPIRESANVVDLVALDLRAQDQALQGLANPTLATETTEVAHNAASASETHITAENTAISSEQALGVSAVRSDAVRSDAVKTSIAGESSEAARSLETSSDEDAIRASRAESITLERIERSVFPAAARNRQANGSEDANAGDGGTRNEEKLLSLGGSASSPNATPREATSRRATTRVASTRDEASAESANGTERSSRTAHVKSDALDESSSQDGRRKPAQDSSGSANDARGHGAADARRAAPTAGDPAQIKLAAAPDTIDKSASATSQRPAIEGTRVAPSALRSPSTSTDPRILRAETMARRLDELMRARRQDAATSAVNQMTLRNGAEGTIELPGLGSVHIAAHTRAGEVDIELRATTADGAAVLHSVSGALEADLRQGSVNLRHLNVSDDGEHDENRDEPNTDHRNRRDHSASDDDGEPKRRRAPPSFEREPFDTAPPVRFVL
ncbi:MAG: hypothetical protein EXR75_11095 [Myxococcales bacterium]|nr:hypothetical protein [Myxococcales bacterium]